MKLSPQHRQAISLLATGMTNKATAEELGLAHEPISRWKSDFDFRAALNELLQENQAASQQRLQSLTATALTTIEQVMTDPNAPPRERISVALKIIELVKLTLDRIGSSSPEVLAQEDENNKFLESLAL